MKSGTYSPCHNCTVLKNTVSQIQNQISRLQSSFNRRSSMTTGSTSWETTGREGGSVKKMKPGGRTSRKTLPRPVTRSKKIRK